MLLAVDIGNSHTVLGLYAGSTLRQTWRVHTTARTADEVGVLLAGLLAGRGVRPEEVTGLALCTVVPAWRAAFLDAGAAFGWRVRGYGDGLDFGMPIGVDQPATLGPDRVVNALAVAARHPAPFLVVDFGTATTFDVVDPTGTFVGGAIAPGLGITADALASRTARLPRVELSPPPAAIGTHTVAAIQSGLVWGYVGLVEGLITRIRAELGSRAPCVATGGLAATIAPHCPSIDEVDPHLTLTGLQIWYEKS